MNVKRFNEIKHASLLHNRASCYAQQNIWNCATYDQYFHFAVTSHSAKQFGVRHQYKPQDRVWIPCLSKMTAGKVGHNRKSDCG